MGLSPLDIHNKEFSRSWQGYDRDEVNEFLEQVIKDYEQAIEHGKKMEMKLQQTEEKLSHFSSIEGTLQSSIIVAQEAAEDVRRNSSREAKLIVKEAEKNADRIVNEALSRARHITLEMEDLKKQSKVFRNRFKMLIQAQLEMVEAEDWDTLLNYDLHSTALNEELED